MLKNTILTKMILALLGIISLSFSIVLLIKTGLGLNALNALYANLSIATGLSIGFFSWFIGFIFISINKVISKKKFNWGALVVAFLIGYCIDFFMKSLENSFHYDYLMTNIVIFIVMTIVSGIAISLLIFSGMPSPLEEYQFAICKLFKTTIGTSKLYTDLSLVIFAVLVGLIWGNGLGQINIGTIIISLVTGKIVDMSLKSLKNIEKKLEMSKIKLNKV
ncbi:YczE/YyaS/YitT family protein [Vallitalea okinawensis]|uniref:YczE/YyaS/YitT family protein n=1 Tax=Vallitalea okinawensis TaxID=2078660 RepID=UPI000CFCF309|nr:hypothetical protein [Vallitalea okinawensis]